ncbi:MAG TPA: class I SAM-dependent methyltransferase [Thermoguttaceae bacterium]|nr:class I SAM-dependent methyltransferase [Thermoguttaceae bacterium]
MNEPTLPDNVETPMQSAVGSPNHGLVAHPPRLHRASRKPATPSAVSAILTYGKLAACKLARRPPSQLERDINRRLLGYPRNHNYQIADRRVTPGFKLHVRSRIVTSLYPEPLESFLDIGCCRGFFVLEAAERPACRAAVGIDVHEPFVSISKRVSEHLGLRAAGFHLATLDHVSRRPEAYGGPFQTVLLLGTYHYLFWGSQLCRNAYDSHREILSRLARICSSRLVFSARLEVSRLPRFLQEKAKASGKSAAYNTSRFLETAEEHFDIQQAGYLGKDPLFVLSRSTA